MIQRWGRTATGACHLCARIFLGPLEDPRGLCLQRGHFSCRTMMVIFEMISGLTGDQLQDAFRPGGDFGELRQYTDCDPWCV